MASRPVVFVGSADPSLVARCAVLPFKLLRVGARGPNDLLLLEDLAPRIPRRARVARVVLGVLSFVSAVTAAALFDSVGAAVALVPFVVLGLLLTVGVGTSASVAAAMTMRTVTDPSPELLVLCDEYGEAVRRADADRSAALLRDIWALAGRS